MESGSYELYRKLVECETLPIKELGELNFLNYFDIAYILFSSKFGKFLGDGRVYAMFKEFEIIRQDDIALGGKPSFILVNHSIDNEVNLKNYLNTTGASRFIDIVNSKINITSEGNKHFVSNIGILDSKVSVDNLIFSSGSYILLDRTEFNMDHKRRFPIWGAVKNFLRFWDEDDSRYISRQYRLLGDECSLAIKSSVYIGSDYDFFFHITIRSCNSKVVIDLTNFRYAAVEFDFHKGAENNEINIIAGPRRVTLNGMYWDYKSVNKITLNGENYE